MLENSWGRLEVGVRRTHALEALEPALPSPRFLPVSEVASVVFRGDPTSLPQAPSRFRSGVRPRRILWRPYF